MYFKLSKESQNKNERTIRNTHFHKKVTRVEKRTCIQGVPKIVYTVT